jgi:crotonobetainyl-CoA:carnitine CoA-transferase CaiB-like acyl-CoA transferase
MAYDFLSDLLVLEVAQFGPNALGGYLADMGARVIKVEPPEGDPLRYAGALAVGSPDGFSYMHLRWNRGKESLLLDLTTPEGVADFLTLARRADVVIEGMRAGVLDRLGVGYQAVAAFNPRVVFCSVSGMGRTGPYQAMASHGPSFDAFAGLGGPAGAEVSKYEGQQPAAVGMHSVSLHAALGVLSAVIGARRTGQGALIEVAAAESAAHWLPDVIEPLLNEPLNHDRPGFNDATGRMRLWARMDNYATRDGKLIYLQSLTGKSWNALIGVLGRPDIQAIYDRTPQTGTEDVEVAAALREAFLEKDRDEWLALFRPANVAAMPVNAFEDLIRDPHFTARDNLYTVPLADARPLTLMGTPVRVDGQHFSANLAPALDEHGDAIRAEFSLEI